MGTSSTKLICTIGKATLINNSTRVCRASMSKTCGSKIVQGAAKKIMNNSSICIYHNGNSKILEFYKEKFRHLNFIGNLSEPTELK